MDCPASGRGGSFAGSFIYLIILKGAARQSQNIRVGRTCRAEVREDSEMQTDGSFLLEIMRGLLGCIVFHTVS